MGEGGWLEGLSQNPKLSIYPKIAILENAKMIAPKNFLMNNYLGAFWKRILLKRKKNMSLLFL